MISRHPTRRSSGERTQKSFQVCVSCQSRGEFLFQVALDAEIDLRETIPSL
jgi:hypothetical protein